MKQLVFLLMCISSVALADDSRKLVSFDGSCTVTVPVAWAGDKIATSPDKKASAIVSHPKAMDSFDEVKGGAKSLYKGKVTKDTATELEIEGPSAVNGKPSVYRAIASGKTFCLVEVDYETGTIEDARRIARTLAAK